MLEETSPNLRPSAKELDKRLKTVDIDRWLATRYAHSSIRDKLVCFYLFVSELDRALTMTEPMLGQIRIQWWREVLEQIFSGAEVRQHDLALALKGHLQDLPIKEHMSDLLACYDDVLEGKQDKDLPPNIETGALIAVCASAVIGDEYLPFEDGIKNCGRAYIAARVQSACAEKRLELAKESYSAIPAQFSAATAYAALSCHYLKGISQTQFGKRWRVFISVLLGKL
jgi:phytoene synthase